MLRGDVLIMCMDRNRLSVVFLYIVNRLMSWLLIILQLLSLLLGVFNRNLLPRHLGCRGALKW